MRIFDTGRFQAVSRRCKFCRGGAPCPQAPGRCSVTGLRREGHVQLATSPTAKRHMSDASASTRPRVNCLMLVTWPQRREMIQQVCVCCLWANAVAFAASIKLSRFVMLRPSFRLSVKIIRTQHLPLSTTVLPASYPRCNYSLRVLLSLCTQHQLHHSRGSMPQRERAQS